MEGLRNTRNIRKKQGVAERIMRKEEPFLTAHKKARMSGDSFGREHLHGVEADQCPQVLYCPHAETQTFLVRVSGTILQT